MRTASSASSLPSTFEAQEREVLRTCFEDLLYLLRTQGHRRLCGAALQAAGLVLADLREASPPLSFTGLYAALSWAHARWPLLPVQFGLRRRTDDYGAFGEAVRASGHPDRRMTLARRYFRAAWGHASLDFEPAERHVVSRYRLHASVVTDPVPVLLAMSAASVAFCRELFPGEDLSAIELRYAFRAPAEAQALRALLGCRVRFNQRHTEFWQPLPWTALPTESIPDVYRQARSLWRNAGSEGGWTGRVRHVLVDVDGRFAAEDAVAAELGLMPRTLRRRLAEEGWTFRALVNEARLELASRCLHDSALSVAEIAERLGYAQPASFYRAFKARFGVAPRARGNPGSGRGRLS